MYMSGYENLKMIANLYEGITKERIDEVIKLVGLENRIKDKSIKIFTRHAPKIRNSTSYITQTKLISIR